jgi:ankyrin repeat protein
MTVNRFGRVIALALAVATLAPGIAIAQSFSGSYTFLKAIRDRDGAKVTELVNQPGSTVLESRDPQTGEGALQIVVKRRDTTWLSFLLGAGANPDFKDRDGNTALIIAASMGFSEGASMLIDKGARVDLTNSSRRCAC